MCAANIQFSWVADCEECRMDMSAKSCPMRKYSVRVVLAGKEGGGEELKGWGDGALRLARVIIVCCRHCQSQLWDRPSILQCITKRSSGALRHISHFQCCNLLSERYCVYYLIQGESAQWLLDVYICILDHCIIMYRPCNAKFKDNERPWA